MENKPEMSSREETTAQPLLSGAQAQVLVGDVLHLLRQGVGGSGLTFFNLLHPVDQGEVLVELPAEPRQQLLASLSPSATAQILEHLEPEEMVQVCESIATPSLCLILDEASPDVAADVLNDLDQVRSREILSGMQERDAVVPLLQHADDTAGGLMTPEYPVVRETTTAANALDQLRIFGPDAEDISSIFVVDAAGRLFGSLSITRLALARPNSIVGDIAELHPLSVNAESDREGSARIMERYNLTQLPVVDEEGRLVGVILVEDMVDVVDEEATEDMYRMAGVPGERLLGPLSNSLRSRLPWLHLNLATLFLAALVISIFESTIQEVVALAIFLPVVAGQGGIGGTQTVTLVVRSMALGELPNRIGFRVLKRELFLGVINGILLGVVVGLIAFAWKGNPILGVVLALAMLGNMLVAALAGAGIPLLLRRLGQDPAVSSAVFVTTFTDIFGFLFFLGLAASLLTWLR